MKRFAIFIMMLANIPAVLLFFIPLSLTDGNQKRALMMELWAGVFISLWVCCLLCWVFIALALKAFRFNSGEQAAPHEPPSQSE